jgi:hypothetical protein
MPDPTPTPEDRMEERLTVGRVVHYHVAQDSRAPQDAPLGPLAAIVIGTYAPAPMNADLAVFEPDAAGGQSGTAAHRVVLCVPFAESPRGGAWTWPPREPARHLDRTVAVPAVEAATLRKADETLADVCHVLGTTRALAVARARELMQDARCIDALDRHVQAEGALTLHTGGDRVLDKLRGAGFLGLAFASRNVPRTLREALATLAGAGR